MKLHTTIFGLAIGLSASLASALPFAIDWSTIEPGGRIQGGTFEIHGVIAQVDAGPILASGSFAVTGGFLAGFTDDGPACPADLDNDGNFDNGASPDSAVTIDDLLFFVTAFELGAPAADLDDNGVDPSQPDGGVTIDDLLFFLVHFEGGC